MKLRKWKKETEQKWKLQSSIKDNFCVSWYWILIYQLKDLDNLKMEGGEAVEEKWGRKGIVLTGEKAGEM